MSRPDRRQLKYPGRSGTVCVYPGRLAGDPAFVLSPTGAPVSTTGTTTQGLQEAITYACANSFDLYIEGGRDVVYVCTTPLVFPAMQNIRITTGAGVIRFTSAVGASDCITFNSCRNGVIEINMHVQSRGTSGSLVVFNPTAAIPLDGTIGFQSNRVYFAGIAAETASGGVTPPSVPAGDTPKPAQDSLVKFNVPTSRDVSNNDFTFQTLSHGKFALKVVGAGTVVENRIVMVWVENQTDGLITGGDGGQVCQNNRVTVNAYAPYGVGTYPGTYPQFPQVGLDINWRTSHFHASISGPTDAVAVRFNDIATNNIVFALNLPGVTSGFPKLLNTTADFSSAVITKSYLPAHVAITLTGSPHTYQNKDSIEEWIQISGGTVTDIQMRRNSDGAVSSVGVSAGWFLLRPGDFIVIVYAVAPAVNKVLQ